MRLHAVTSTFILCKPEVVGSIPIVSTMKVAGQPRQLAGFFCYSHPSFPPRKTHIALLACMIFHDVFTVWL